MPFDIESRFETGPTRAESAEEVKKLVGLSSAVLTFAGGQRFCVVLSRVAVLWRASRFWRTPADRVMLKTCVGTFLGRVAILAVGGRSLGIARHRSRGPEVMQA
jgi:hypothetical protein